MKTKTIFFIMMILALTFSLSAEIMNVTGERYLLSKEDWNGTAVQKDGISKVGGYERLGSVAYDYETLCNFTIPAMNDVVTNAVLKVKLIDGLFGIDNTVVLYEQNKGSWDSATVCYNSFDYTNWTNALASVDVVDAQGSWITFTGQALLSVVQNWIEQPASNKGLVLAANLHHFDYYMSIEDVVLELHTESKKKMSENIRQYYINNTEWSNSARWTYAYIIENNTESTEQINYNWDSAANDWSQLTIPHIIKTVDMEGRVIFEEAVNRVKTYNTYDAAGLLVEKIVDARINSMSYWEYDRYVYVYDESGNLIEENEYERDNDTDPWVFTMQYKYFYDTEGRLKNKVQFNTAGQSTGNVHSYIYTSNTIEDIYNGQTKETTTFDANGTRIAFDTFVYDPATGDWAPRQKEQWTYNANNLLSEYVKETFDGTAWKNYKKETYVYNEVGKIIVFDTFNWVEDGQYWLLQYENRYAYDVNGYLISDTKMYNSNGILVNSMRYLYSYE